VLILKIFLLVVSLVWEVISKVGNITGKQEARNRVQVVV
jgi:hypothetical protein